MSAVFGIHFGSTNACICVIKDGKPQVLTNDLGDRLTACIVAYNEGDIGVGAPARQNMIRNLHNTVLNARQLIGQSFTEVAQYVKQNDVKVVDIEGLPVVVMRGEGGANKQFAPSYIATLIFKKLMETARSYSSQEEFNVVLSVPCHFKPSQKAALTQAAEQAGFSTLRLINQSSSPILAYHLLLEPHPPPSTVMVLRVGGTSCDVTLLRVASGMCSSLVYMRDDQLGGVVVDNLIVNLLASEFKRKTRMDCTENKRSMFKLRQAAEECKKILSNASTTTSACHVESLFEGVDFSHPLSRLRLEALSGPFVSSVVELCKKTQGDIAVVDKIIMVGGVANTPSLVKKVQTSFPITTILSHLPPDQCIAIGNAMQAHILMSRRRSEDSVKSVHIPCLSNDVLIQTGEGHQLLFPRGTAIPLKKQVHFKLATPQQSALLEVFQRVEGGGDVGVVGLEENAESRMSPLLSVVLASIDKSNTIDAIFHFRHDGSLHLTCSSGDENQDLVVNGGLNEARQAILL